MAAPTFEKLCSKPRKGITNVTHVLFDLDGIIIDSEPVYKRIAEEICEEYGKKYTKKMKLKVMGHRQEETCKIIIEDLNLPISLDEFMDKFDKKAIEYLQNPKLIPGVVDVIQHLHSSGVPIAVATASPEAMMRMKTANFRCLMKMFHHIVSGDSDPGIRHGKPAPDIFLVCASKFSGNKPCPCSCLVFEDSPNGVRAALNAGMQVIMIPDPDLPKDDPIRLDATLVISDFSKFEPDRFGLPARKRK